MHQHRQGTAIVRDSCGRLTLLGVEVVTTRVHEPGTVRRPVPDPQPGISEHSAQLCLESAACNPGRAEPGDQVGDRVIGARRVP